MSVRDSDTEFIEMNHPVDPPKFKFEEGQSFKLANEPEPEEYWYIKARLWNYDADTEDAIVAARAFKQYLIGEVSTLGGGERIITEENLVQHYETVDKETAKEVLNK